MTSCRVCYGTQYLAVKYVKSHFAADGLDVITITAGSSWAWRTLSPHGWGQQGFLPLARMFPSLPAAHNKGMLLKQFKNAFIAE